MADFTASQAAARLRAAKLSIMRMTGMTLDDYALAQHLAEVDRAVSPKLPHGQTVNLPHRRRDDTPMDPGAAEFIAEWKHDLEGQR